MQNQIDTLRQLNYELIKNLGLFRQRAGLYLGQRHTLYHINAHQGLSIQELAELLQVDHSTMSRECQKADAGGFGGNISGRCRQKA